jgi:hypothetical protein
VLSPVDTVAWCMPLGGWSLWQRIDRVGIYPTCRIGVRTDPVCRQNKIAYDVRKALNAAAKAAGEFGVWSGQWAVPGASRARARSAVNLTAELIVEFGDG